MEGREHKHSRLEATERQVQGMGETERAPEFVKGHVRSARDDTVQHAVWQATRGCHPTAAVAVCGRPVQVQRDQPRAFDPDAGVLDPPCKRCARAVKRAS